MDPLTLTAAQEAALIGVHRSNVTWARRDPTHPAHATDHGGHLTATHPGASVAGRSVSAPTAAVVAWWADRQRGKGQPGSRIPPRPTHRQWWNLLDHVRDGAPLPDAARDALTARGVLDAAGALTVSGRAMVAASSHAVSLTRFLATEPTTTGAPT